jgi:D-beta-D-heptose 7-phosphate kinase/D-beta-D-heptose 1-phosphate adenosyltransferase
MIINKKVLVIGDLIIDSSKYGEAVGLSLESPTMKAKLTKSDMVFGGSANVVNNLVELGAEVSYMTLLGNDKSTIIPEEDISNFTKNLQSFIPITEDRKNTIKERFWIEKGNQLYKYFQLDVVDNKPMSDESFKEIFDTFEECKPVIDFDVILLIDYGHGLFTKDFTKKIVSLFKKWNIPTIASSQISNWGDELPNHINFDGVDLIVMNSKEAEHNKDINFESDICITKGEKGSQINEIFVKSEKVKEVDSCGAGDSFISCLALTDWVFFPEESLQISNSWASLAVQEVGTTVPKLEDLILD